MPDLTLDMVLDALRPIQDPDLHKDIVTLGFVTREDIRITGSIIAVRVTLTTPACPVKERMEQEVRERVGALPGVERVDVTMTAVTATGRGPAGAEGTGRLPQVKNIVAVGS